MFLFEYIHAGHIALMFFLVQSFILLCLWKRFDEQSLAVSDLQKELKAMFMCERGMADRIRYQQQQVHGISNRQDTLEINGASQVNYKQAIALMRKGATTDELVEACDISIGELDLILHLENTKKMSPQNSSRN